MPTTYVSGSRHTRQAALAKERPRRVANSSRSDDGHTLPGIIPAGAILRVDEAKKRLQLGEWAWRRLRRDGLRIIRVGGRAFVLADDLIEFFQGRTEQNGDE